MPSHLFCSTFFSLSPSYVVVTQIRGHIHSRRFSPLPPHYGSCLAVFLPVARNISALCSLVDSHRVQQRFGLKNKKMGATRRYSSTPNMKGYNVSAETCCGAGGAPDLRGNSLVLSWGISTVRVRMLHEGHKCVLKRCTSTVVARVKSEGCSQRCHVGHV